MIENLENLIGRKDVGTPDKNGETPVQKAVKELDSITAVEMLIFAGADINAVDRNGSMGSFFLCRKKKYKEVTSNFWRKKWEKHFWNAETREKKCKRYFGREGNFIFGISKRTAADNRL